MSWYVPEFCRYAYSTNSTDLYNPDKFKRLVDKIADVLLRINRKYPFDAIAGSGFSSLPLLGALSIKLDIPYIAVRKEEERAHSSDVQGLVYSPRYVIVDDLIESGATIDRIVKGVITAHNNVLAFGATDGKGSVNAGASFPQCVAIVLYAPFGMMKAGRDYEGIPVFGI